MHLGLSAEQFFELTRRQLYVLMDQYGEHVRHQEWLAATIAATTANFSLCRPEKPLAPADFFPSLATTPRHRAPVRHLSRQLIAQNIRCFLLGQIAAQEQNQQHVNECR